MRHAFFAYCRAERKKSYRYRLGTDALVSRRAFLFWFPRIKKKAKGERIIPLRGVGKQASNTRPTLLFLGAEAGVATEQRKLQSGAAAVTMVSCVLCNAAQAVVFCYNDNANLCKGCDSQIHQTNRLSWKHQRVHLCEMCENHPKPAVVYCTHDKVSDVG